MKSNYVIKEFKGLDPELDQYKAVIQATWLRGLKHGSEFFGLVDTKIFFTVYSKVVMALITRPEATVRIAVLADDHDVIVGWSAFEGKILHYVFVRPGEKGASPRKHGIATALVPKDFEMITHLTKVGKSIWRKKYRTVKFNPF
jgi:hypothetical protein